MPVTPNKVETFANCLTFSFFVDSAKERINTFVVDWLIDLRIGTMSLENITSQISKKMKKRILGWFVECNNENKKFEYSYLES